MSFFIVALILILGGILAALVVKTWVPLVATVLGVLVLVFSLFYSIGAGEAAAVRNTVNGDIRSVSEPGFQTKAPWEKVYMFDVRDNIIEFSGKAESTVSGADIRNAQITIQDSEGVSSNVDVSVNYSILPDQVGEILRQYGSQEAFVQRIALARTRSAVRDVPGDFTTMALLTERERLSSEMQLAMERRLEGTGVIIEAVNLQEIRVPDAVLARFTEAQEARVQIEKAQAEQQTAIVNAETRRIEAQGQADSNRILAESLSEPVLRQHYIDALNKSGTIYVVPEGSQPLVSVK